MWKHSKIFYWPLHSSMLCFHNMRFSNWTKETTKFFQLSESPDFLDYLTSSVYIFFTGFPFHMWMFTTWWVWQEIYFLSVNLECCVDMHLLIQKLWLTIIYIVYLFQVACTSVFESYIIHSGSSSTAPNTRVMIFCQFRDIVREITELLQQHRPLVRPMQFVGHAVSTNPNEEEKSSGKTNRRFTQKDQLMVSVCCLWFRLKMSC